MNERGIKLVLLGAFVCLIGLLVWLFIVGKNAQQQPQDQAPNNDKQPISVIGSSSEVMLLSDATIKIPDSDAELFISLTDGKGRFVMPQSTQYGEVALDPHYVASASGRIFASFGLNTGGTGYFSYLGYFEKQGNAAVHRDSIFLGDRIIVKEIAVNEAGDTVTVEYLDRASGEPFSAAPTEEVTKTFIIEGGSLSELGAAFEMEEAATSSEPNMEFGADGIED